MKITSRRWFSLFLIFTISILVQTSGSWAESTTKEVTKDIQGTWHVQSSKDTVKITEKILVHRQEAPAGFMPPFIYAGTNAQMGSEKGSNGNYFVIGTYSYVLRTDVKPMQIDLTVADEKGTKCIFKGVFEVQSDKLTLCYSKPNNERPKGFTKSMDNTLLLLQRDKGK